MYTEVGSSSVLPTLNLDARLQENSRFGYKFGFGAITNFGDLSYSIPFQFNYLAGKRKRIELGMGFTSLVTVDFDSFLFGSLAIMWRRQWKSGFNFRIDISLIFRLGDDNFIFPYPGFSLGYRLNNKKYRE